MQTLLSTKIEDIKSTYPQITWEFVEIRLPFHPNTELYTANYMQQAVLPPTDVLSNASSKCKLFKYIRA
jgi:predicted metalloenzyme YecM